MFYKPRTLLLSLLDHAIAAAAISAAVIFFVLVVAVGRLADAIMRALTLLRLSWF